MKKDKYVCINNFGVIKPGDQIEIYYSKSGKMIFTSFQNI